MQVNAVQRSAGRGAIQCQCYRSFSSESLCHGDVPNECNIRREAAAASAYETAYVAIGNRLRRIRRQIKNDVPKNQGPDLRALSAIGNAISPFPLGPEQLCYLRGREVLSKTVSEEV
jgi:hypothetical protein